MQPSKPSTTRIKVVISDEAAIGTFGDEHGERRRAAERRVRSRGYHYNTDDDAVGSFKQASRGVRQGDLE
ncbi:MAG: hypothetical protein QM756_33300 [Polyangiaceae bacterium]